MRLTITFLLISFLTLGFVQENQAAQVPSNSVNQQYESLENHSSQKKTRLRKKGKRKKIKLGFGDWSLILGGVLAAMYVIPAFVGSTFAIILLNLSGVGISVAIAAILAGRDKKQRRRAWLGLLLAALPLIGFILELAMIVLPIFSIEFSVWLPKFLIT